jgi:two-component system chemotaxis sensor kinase CheA
VARDSWDWANWNNWLTRLKNLLGKLRDNALTLTAEITSALLEAVDVCNCGLHAVENPAEAAAFQPEPVIERLNRAVTGKPQGDLSTPPAPAPPKPVPAAPPIQPVKTESAPAAATSAAADAATDKLQDTTIRVDVALLDKLMTRVGELVLARNQILQRTSGLEDAEFVRTAQRLNLITTELQEGVMKTRMQPIGNVWAKFPRVVRDLSAQLGKQIRIEMDGKETELDKTIVEAIKDPLTHLVRNSIDHGIETPAARRAAGKSEEGCLTLRAYHEGGQVNIEITDDGTGLNIDRIRKKALEKGLITAEQASRLSEREAAQLILLPGFSTAEQVTSVSGRGVGMDVVKTNIEKIGGTLDLQTRPGQGTTIKIKIPLTLAIIPALIVTCDGDRYAIPQVSLLELVRLEGDQATRGIETVHDTPVYRLRGKLLPLVYLSEHLRLRGNSAQSAVEENSAINIVVLRADDRQFGLVVDKVNDTEEIVVKPLGKQLKSVAEYAGATIMGDGDVALILDVKGLAVASGLGHEIRDRSVTTEGKAVTESTGRKETLLIVDVGDARGFALPTSMVARLEKISRTAVELANGREVIQYRGAILPLVRLADVVGGAPPAAADLEMQVIVYDELGKRFGLVVERIVDITEAELNFAIDQDADHYLLGTTVVQQRVKDVLNLRNLARFDRAAGVL